MTSYEPRARRGCQRGFTLIEVTIVSAMLGVLFYVLSATILTGTRASVTTTSAMDLTDSLRKTVRRIADELRSSGRNGEDTNANTVLDAGEDRNGNGRLDADWKTTPTSVTFNRMRADRTYSLPITYRLKGKNLERVTTLSASGRTMVTLVARGLTKFDVAETGKRVQIVVGMEHLGPDGRLLTQDQTIRLTFRN